MKKPVRLLLLTAGFGVVASLVVVGLAFNAGVQTWVARRAFAGQPNLQVKVGRVVAGFQTVALHDLSGDGSKPARRGRVKTSHLELVGFVVGD